MNIHNAALKRTIRSDDLSDILSNSPAPAKLDNKGKLIWAMDKFRSQVFPYRFGTTPKTSRGTIIRSNNLGTYTQSKKNKDVLVAKKKLTKSQLQEHIETLGVEPKRANNLIDRYSGRIFFQYDDHYQLKFDKIPHSFLYEITSTMSKHQEQRI